MSEQNKKQEKALYSKERVVTASYEKANNWWWLCRYVADLQYIKPTDTVLDIGMGCGIGASILSEKAKFVVGIDDSLETIEFANKYWTRNNSKFHCMDCFQLNPNDKYDVVIAHEIIEHIKDTDKLFKLLGDITINYLIFTTPLNTDPIKNKWHWRHLSLKEIKEQLSKNNFKLILERFMDKPYFVCQKLTGDTNE